jgi:predicted TIM-barrel enzyme
MTAVGANFVVAHMGLTTGGNIGTQSVLALGDCPALIDGMASAARPVNPNVIVLCYGGAISRPGDADFVLHQCQDCLGCFGASSMERLPSEQALVARTQAFTKVGGKL